MSESFFVAHNAHLEAETTVARHLLHRERLGETLVFATQADRALCEAGGDVWELSVRRQDGTLAHFVGASLSACLATAQRQLQVGAQPSLAA
ncbi:hypothetical protein [Flavisphingomonas formosensis]|uniref:hypothetical protein n=1 Tax=Flavisphingomonas formosensis TaxID=861534 RepID=UPI0018DF730C|nr:hypothetical protein [Sphingomonas formosensis]